MFVVKINVLHYFLFMPNVKSVKKYRPTALFKILKYY